MGRVNPLLLAVAAALVVFAIFPRGLVPLNDGFGYIRSIALTFQHGRPWTDDWLEPWSAGFSTLGALAFAATGSMYLATYGICAALMGAAAWACHRLLLVRGVPSPTAAAVTLGLMFFPTILWKFLEVNAFALYFACLFLALLNYERRNWLGFTFAWCVALSSRQSAVAWGALPAYAVVSVLVRRDTADQGGWLRPLATVGVAAGFFGFMTTFMNKTHAQAVITDHMLDHWNATDAARTAGIALLAAGVGYGLGSIVMGARWTDAASRGRRLLAGVALLLMLIGSLGGDLRNKVALDHDAFQVPVLHFCLVGVCLLGAVGVGLSAFRVRADYLLAVGAGMVVLLLRSATWDYYLADVPVFAFLAAAARGPAAEKLRVRPFGFGVVTAISLLSVVHFKMRYDREYLVDTLGARALARGAISAPAASFLPFGAQGWFFFPYYSSHEGKDSADLAGFGRYLRPDAYGVAERYPRLLRTFSSFRGTLPADRSTIVEQERFSYLWFFHVDAALVRLPAATHSPADLAAPRDLVIPALPLTDAEWREQLGR